MQPLVKNFDDTLTRYDSIHERDKQTQTDGHRMMA